MRILITGVTGFAGSWLAETMLSDSDCQVFGLCRNARWPAGCESFQDRVQLRPCDLCESGQVERILREVAPDQIYHLAGYASAGRSFVEPDNAWQGNLSATRSLLDAVSGWGGSPRILSVTSGMVYGRSTRDDHVVDEESPFLPVSPYGASKAAADVVSYQYVQSHKLQVMRARPFNHLGPRQSPLFALASFARQLGEILDGKREPEIETGDLSSERDCTDVRDVVRAYVLLMERGQVGEAYNVAGGHSWSMQALLDQLVEISGAKVEVRQRADLLRAADAQRMEVSTSKLRDQTGWTPVVPIEQTLRDVLAYWRNQS